MKKEKFDFYSKTSIKSYNLDDKIRYQLKMLDSLDAFTRAHSENVANLTCRLCEYLNADRKYGKGFTVYATTCAYLHDIGKLFIPPSILQKQAALTSEEYEVMKTHTTIGYKICMEDLKLRPYAAGTIFHHESLDGSGYPNGLTRKDIPIEGQIIRIADEFDAISSKRQYKTHVGVVDTLNLLIDDSKPKQNTTTDQLRILSAEANDGKIDKNILKFLFEIIIDDTEYEIEARIDYLKYLEEEKKRLDQAHTYYKKMLVSKGSKINYFKEGAEAYLRPNELLEECPTYYNEICKALIDRNEHIKKLNAEIKQIKHLKV